MALMGDKEGKPVVWAELRSDRKRVPWVQERGRTAGKALGQAGFAIRFRIGVAGRLRPGAGNTRRFLSGYTPVYGKKWIYVIDKSCAAPGSGGSPPLHSDMVLPAHPVHCAIRLDLPRAQEALQWARKGSGNLPVKIYGKYRTFSRKDSSSNAECNPIGGVMIGSQE